LVRRTLLEQAASFNSDRSSTAGTYERSAALRRSIFDFYKVQDVYMPGALGRRSEALADNDEELGFLHAAEHLPVILPSDLPEAIRSSGCLRGVVEIEKRYADARMKDALCNVRRYRRILVAIQHKFKHQKNGTSSEIPFSHFRTLSFYFSTAGRHTISDRNCWSRKKAEPCRGNLS
jgi:hypothetical protein